MAEKKCPHGRRPRACGLCNGVGVYGQHLRSATVRNLTNELTDARYRWLLQLPCVYCGDPAGGVDRVKSEYGYTTLNSVSACFRCNSMKSTKSAPTFIAGTAAVVAHTATYEQFKNRWIETRTTGPDLTCPSTSTNALPATTALSDVSGSTPKSTVSAAGASWTSSSRAQRGSSPASSAKVVERATRRKADDVPRPPEPEVETRTTK